MEKMFIEYFITCDRKAAVSIAKRLMYCQEAFDWNGGRTLHFTVQKDRENWIKGVIQYHKRRSERENTVFEIERYEV